MRETGREKDNRQRRTHTSTQRAETVNPELQEELTGFDVVGHRGSAVLVGGIAERCDVRGDLDTDHTLNALLSLLLGCCLEDLAQRHTVKNTETHSVKERMQLSLNSC